MNRYSYTLNPGQNGPERRQTYKRSQLEKMTTFQLREICRKEKLVIPSPELQGRDGLVRLVMRFRGQKDYRHITGEYQDGLKRVQDFLDRNPVAVSYADEVRIPGTITLYEEIGLNELDNYQIESAQNLYEGNLLLVDELNHIYTCLYIKEKNKKFYLFKGKTVPVLPLEKHQYSILYFPSGSLRFMSL